MTAVIWTKEATDDRDAIYDYIELDSILSAVEMDKLFEDKSIVLGEHPTIGRVGRIAGTREFVIHRHYIFVYDIINETVRILRLMHASKQWPDE